MRVGILGGGQLGSLLLNSVYKLGATAAIYDQDKSAPGLQRTLFAFNGDWVDENLLGEFLASVNVATYEFENVDSQGLEKLSHLKPIMPGVHVLKTTQDRAFEKKFLADNSLPHVDFLLVNSVEELRAQSEKFGYPFILKTARGGYDGKGQFVIRSNADLEQFRPNDSREFRMVMERLIDLKMEVSCIVARSPLGEEVTFPVFENVHHEQILDLTIAPARISASLEAKIKEIALSAARALNVHGLLTTEFFLSDSPGANAQGVQVGSWHIFVNEFAPRPHNSGHVSMNACTISQFDALARILLGVPLVEPQIVAPGYFCMGNLLGDVWLAQGRKELDLSILPQHPEVIDVVLYGKEEPRAKRKMGHFVTYSQSAQSAVGGALAFRAALSQRQATAAT